MNVAKLEIDFKGKIPYEVQHLGDGQENASEVRKGPNPVAIWLCVREMAATRQLLHRTGVSDVMLDTGIR